MQIDRYASRLSGPLRDRIDLTVTVSALPTTDLIADGTGESTAVIRGRVEAARARQYARGTAANASGNARIGPRLLRKICALDSRSERLLHDAAERLGLTARAFDRTLRVARTIGDLEGTDRVGYDHVAESLQYRG